MQGEQKNASISSSPNITATFWHKVTGPNGTSLGKFILSFSGKIKGGFGQMKCWKIREMFTFWAKMSEINVCFFG